MQRKVMTTSELIDHLEPLVVDYLVNPFYDDALYTVIDALAANEDPARTEALKNAIFNKATSWATDSTAVALQLTVHLWEASDRLRTMHEETAMLPGDRSTLLEHLSHAATLITVNRLQDGFEPIIHGVEALSETLEEQINDLFDHWDCQLADVAVELALDAKTPPGLHLDGSRRALLRPIVEAAQTTLRGRYGDEWDGLLDGLACFRPGPC